MMVACAKLPTQIISDFGNSAVAQLFWDPDFCLNKNDGDKFPYPNNCWEYFICQNGRLNFGECAWPQLFDPFRGTCDDSHNVVCLNADQGGTHDPLCPAPGSDDLVFLPAKDCEFYYICVNGHPVLTFCRPGEHWNMWDEFCDTPGNAGCDVSSLYRLLCFKLKSFFPQPNALPPAVPLPNCPNRVVSLPHPHNCNWFIHCSGGNRSIQQCQHLHHFDVHQERCLFQTVATCIKNV